MKPPCGTWREAEPRPDADRAQMAPSHFLLPGSKQELLEFVR